MGALGVLLKASRPAGWLVAPLVLITAALWAQAQITWQAWLLAAALSLPYCVILYGINDVHDYGSDRHNPRKQAVNGLIEGGVLAPRWHGLIKRASVAAAALVMLAAVLTLDIGIVIVTALMLLVSYYYSAPPLRFKERPPWDSVSNGVVFLCVFALGWAFSGSLLLPLEAYLIAFCVVGLHAFTTIMDRSTDLRAGHRTFAIAFGKRAAAALALLSIVVALLTGEWFVSIIQYCWLCLACYLAVLIWPSERLASWLFKLVGAGFMVTAVRVVVELSGNA